ncbi:MAG: formate hydrogenlyase [Candidatus Omnitrophica bacterium CG12_big_fil_rev_8_21_14_0_65_45_16]|nr:MAG: formate hydrogenlyase [Candidatus Omnitrophica bacterium CG22_combo_CG10-13_8_21_14_all_43_16]PIW64911.1 MAG: formate hydrogenlyase [Candidatus Omnitrophica bacterium CG12_big_fil_rev_8_21_14_0_65_45_16]
MIKIMIIVLQLILFIAAAPILSGLISKIKNNIRLRKGQGILQPYYNLAKLFFKGEVVSETASWIFRVTPIVVLSSTLTAAALIPVFIFSSPMRQAGDFLVLVFIFALGRFFLALSALDTGSSFGGMGSSREMFISSLVEPALCMVILSVSLQFGSTDISAFNGIHAISVSSIVAAIALFLITIAETSRMPVDNQETHLELTMVHEAMVLEYSGRSLALIEMAAYIKQMILFFLIAQIVFPIALPVFSSLTQLASWILWYLTRIIIIAISAALVEISVAKMRLFRVADFLGFAFVLGIIAVICAMLGV